MVTPAALASVLADEARRHGLSLVDVAAEVALLATREEVPEPRVRLPYVGMATPGAPEHPRPESLAAAVAVAIVRREQER